MLLLMLCRCTILLLLMMLLLMPMPLLALLLPLDHGAALHGEQPAAAHLHDVAAQVKIESKT